jgi:undecaprenyl-diphosphatase
MDWELNFIWWANQWWSSPIFDYFLPWLTYLGSHFAVFVFIILSFVFTRERKVFRHLFLLYGIQSAVIYSLKFLIHRKRPFLFLEMTSKLSKGPGEILDPSFPSAHAAFSFMMAYILSIWFPRYRLLFFIFAGFISWTRIYLGLHYPTDVILGAFLGYGITWVFSLMVSKISIDKG